MFKISEITSKKEWEDFLDDPKIAYYPFFQSWNFGQVQQKTGFNIVRRGVYKKGRLVAMYQMAEVKARRGHYIHLRHGPVLKPFEKSVFDFLLSDVTEFAHAKGATFIRISPTVRKEDVDYKMLASKGFKNAPIHRLDAEICWVLDINVSEEELLKGMRKSHRYLIKRGIMNKELGIRKTKNPKDIEKFLPLYQSLSKRKRFVPHKEVREEFEIFGKDDEEVLYLAEFENRVIAGALIAFVGNMAIYRHSASDDNFRNIPAMHVILWEALKDAKKRNKKLFNFWGIAPQSSKRHPWQGHTLFKTGFGGKQLEFLHAQDLPLSLKYWKTFAIEYTSKLLKGY